MKVVQINITCGVGSTGKICVEVSKLLTQQGVENYILYSSESTDYPLGIKYTSELYVKTQALKSRLGGKYGFNSKAATKKLIAHLERIKPDIVHLHNLHGHNCDLEMLLKYLKVSRIRVFWTFHDCWAFTAYCPYFTLVQCEQWKTECKRCPRRKRFSWFFDRSAELYQRKKKALDGLDLTIVTPSQWLADMTAQSFLKDYPVKVINNGVDLSVFRPTHGDFRTKYAIGDKYVVLGVAFAWEVRKGLDVFIELAKRLDSQKYQIVLVGTDDRVDRKLPGHIISIHRTQNQTELAEIYTAADIFANPTREENFPTVNIEALACGTPVVTFRTGGSPEILDSTCGSVVDCEDIDHMQAQIIRICETGVYGENACIERAAKFESNERFKQYIELYEVNDEPK